jgi:hypothetical protein
MNLPFNENIKDGFYIRTFSSDVLNENLKWHWDEEDRIVECENETDWEFQMDNDLPYKIPKNLPIFIPKGQFHRLIKGTGDLTLKIKKIY